MLIVLEGIDGCGKSTVAPLVAQRLSDSGGDAAFSGKQAIGPRDPRVRGSSGSAAGSQLAFS